MARTIVWDELALEDLIQAADYIARDSRHYAQALIDRASEAVRSLLQFPESGRKVPELDQSNVRELFVQRYRLIDQLRGEEIHVLAFVHGARDFAALWQREGDARLPGDHTGS